ncbi:paraquat-inducible protein A [Bowmanella dokdonensis]|uniref:Paraquat-inducible protein A n=1 Tax=Bowmanella dokdonensis TaxID=751969 RepID=A0A939IQH4_9ALTE|nr:paraquat-inducible protein A [Bowmanella dokdonensis]MBN7824461.1 paraquat-inducible protein A [Bowmanella dokdonensis]
MQIYCAKCGQIQDYQAPEDGEVISCGRCDQVLIRAVQGGNFPCLMLVLAALILYVPANIYPIMTMTYLGRSNETTIFGGVVNLYQSGMVGLAVLVFTVSILVPLIKIIVLLYLTLLANRYALFSEKVHHKILRFVDAIGPWSMLDVFLVAILVSLVKLQDLARVEPEVGIVAFAGVVVLTLIASQVFDSRLLWKPPYDE